MLTTVYPDNSYLEVKTLRALVYRTIKQGDPPSSYEAAKSGTGADLTRTMSLGVEDVPSPAVGGRTNLNKQASLKKLILLGPISLNIELDAESLHASGYEKAQRRLVDYLNGLPDSAAPPANLEWTFRELSEHALLFAPPGFENRSLLPMAFLQFQSCEASRKAESYLKAYVRDEWTVTSCYFNFFTFGFATIHVDLKHCSGDPHLGRIESTEKFSHQFAQHLPELINDVAGKFESGVQAVLPGLVVSSLKSKERHSGLLWLQRIVVWKSDDFNLMTKEAKAAVPGVHEILTFRDMLVIPAVDTSVVCLKLRHREPEDWIIRIFELEAAVTASLLHIDGWLFDALNHVVLTSRIARQSQAAEAVREAQASFERVELHRSKIDSTIAFMGSHSVAVFEARSRVSGLPQLETSISRKLELLGRLSQDSYASIEIAHSRRLNRLALIFTLFSAASSGIALVDFAYGGKWLSTSELRIFVLLGMLLAILVGTMLALREARVQIQERTRKEE